MMPSSLAYRTVDTCVSSGQTYPAGSEVRMSARLESTGKRLPHTAAFTLVEVLLVVILLAIGALIAAPAVSESDATRVQSAAMLLTADLQFAQFESIAHADEPRGVRFDIPNNRYEVVRANGTSTLDCSQAVVLTNPVDKRPYRTEYGGSRGAELAGVTIDSYSLDGDACVAFGALGETDQTAAATVVLRSGSSTITVSIDAGSGEASITP